MRELSAPANVDLGGPPSAELTLTHLDSLPTLPAIAVRLLQITGSDESELRHVVDALRCDQSLTAKLLSTANAANRGAGRVSTLERAVLTLGFTAVRSIVLAVKVFECFAPFNASPERGLRRKEFWKHSLAVACAARRLAAVRDDNGIDNEEAFVAGLLHDLGKVALDAVFPRAYDRIVSEAEESRGDITDFEQTTLGIVHTVAGRRLAERWGLPREFQEVIWLHHLSVETLPSGVSCPGLIGVVQLADTIAREQRIGYSGNFSFYEPSSTLADYLGFSDSDVQNVVANLAGDVAQQCALIDLDQDTPEAVYLRSLSQANSELGKLNNDLVASNRRLAAAARYFKAITHFDTALSAWSDLSAACAAVADAAAIALQRPNLATFAIRQGNTALELVWICERSSDRGQLADLVTPTLRAWLEQPGESLKSGIVAAPWAVRSLLTPALKALGTGECWLAPIVHDRKIAGGIVFMSQRDERSLFADEVDELRSFLASIGLALGRANAQAAARKLSDDLAEMNRKLQQMQGEVLRSRTLSMIAEMASGAGHEINSPLTVISGRAQLLRDQTRDEKTRKTLDQIVEKAHECSTIVRELMEFARPRPPETAAFDWIELLEQASGEFLTHHDLPASRLVLSVPEPSPGQKLPLLIADREQVRMVLGELLENALDATRETQGEISISARIGAADASWLAGKTATRDLGLVRAPRRWLQIAVRDRGIGMGSAILRRAFDPFFSHREAGRRRGLGLARAYRIIEAHNGRIWLESQPQQGTTAFVVLPLSE